jgi:CRP-like cAMP-binding protein
MSSPAPTNTLSRSQRRAFSLLEVVISLFLVGTVMVVAMQVFVSATAGRIRNGNQARGILLAQAIANRLIYNRTGNRVSLVFNEKVLTEQAAPVGFAKEEVITVKKGDVVMNDGEVADCLYYISSGHFSVYHKKKVVGTITPSDIFMGEMAFLLSNTRTATVVADRQGKIIKIPRESFISVIKEYPQYSMFISKLLARKLVQANESTTSASSEKE